MHMPNIVVDGPPIPVEKKRRLVKELAEVAVDVYGIPHIVVLIRENKPDCVGINGELICDRRKAEKRE